jgi:hypothetical protein
MRVKKKVTDFALAVSQVKVFTLVLRNVAKTALVPAFSVSGNVPLGRRAAALMNC